MSLNVIQVRKKRKIKVLLESSLSCRMEVTILAKLLLEKVIIHK